jgi:glycerol-3-phosphate dehydrogenase
MQRNNYLQQLANTPQWEVIIIGGGATGLGCAIDAARRGYKTLLVEKYDFGKGTSSRSTKLVHGGVRYLAQGNIRLVREALFERGRLLQNAPHVAHTLSFIVPSYKWWQKWYYGFGLWIYEFLSAKLSLGKTKLLGKKQAATLLPNLNLQNCNGGVLYKDGQFDDSRLAINLAQTAAEQGATVLNYCNAVSFVKNNNSITGVVVEDTLSHTQYTAMAKVVINATGVYADGLLQLAEGHNQSTIAPSQGIHLVVEPHFFTGTHGLMIPKTEDGRVLFCIPWHGKVVLGTTDTPVGEVVPEPRPLEEEIDFVLRHFNLYTAQQITRADVLSMYAGLRPLAKVQGQTKTAVMPRDHQIHILSSGLVHITGGKWTTYRRMAEDAITKAAKAAGLPTIACSTQQLPIHGYSNKSVQSHLAVYGSDADAIANLIQSDNRLAALLHPAYPYTCAEVVWMVQQEMAQTVEDVLARRIRLLFLDARAAMAAASVAAAVMAPLLGHGADWEAQQTAQFTQLAKGYLP